MLKSGPNHWGSLAKFFHWTIVVLILVQGTIGLVMVELPKRPNVIPVFSFHKSLGLTILALALGAPAVPAIYGLFAALLLAGGTEAASQLIYYRLG